jgi:hypothetical protein
MRLVRITVTALAALFALIGPMTSSTSAADPMGVGDVDAVASSFVPTNLPNEPR